MPKDPKEAPAPIDDSPDSAMELAFEVLRREYPKATAKAKLRPMRWFDKLLAGPDAHAVTYPTNSIVYDRDKVVRDQGFNTDLLAHELTHVNQNLAHHPWQYVTTPINNLRFNYFDNPLEQEAYDVMTRRALKRRDIVLPKDK